MWRYYNSTYKDILPTIGTSQLDGFEYYLTNNSGQWFDDTWDSWDSGTGDLTMVTTSGDAIYFGRDSETFDTIYWTLGTNGVGGVIAWEYWNGSTWATLSTTSTLNPNFDATDGYIMFNPPGDWTKGEAGPTEGKRYYVRARVTTTFTTTPVGQGFGTDTRCPGVWQDLRSILLPHLRRRI